MARLMLLLMILGTVAIVASHRAQNMKQARMKGRLAQVLLNLQKVLLKERNPKPEFRDFLDIMAQIKRDDPRHDFNQDEDMFEQEDDEDEDDGGDGGRWRGNKKTTTTRPPPRTTRAQKFSKWNDDDDFDDDDSMFDYSDKAYVVVIEMMNKGSDDYDDDDDMFEIPDKKYMVEVKTTPLPCKESKCPISTCPEDYVAPIRPPGAFVPSLNAVSRSACGKQYVFSNIALTFRAAGQACCKENMNLVSIESQEEFTCLQELYKGEISKGSVFWSSGMYLGCPYSYRWCSSLARFAGGAAWTEGELANPNACVAVSYFDKNPLKMSFSDEVCNKTYKFICESVTQDDFDQRTAIEEEETPQCDTPTCPKLDCSLAPISSSNVDVEIACGRRYILVEDSPASYMRAQETCCEMGMRLLSVETRSEQICLQKKFAGRIGENTHLWTSGTDLGCEGKFHLCGANSDMSTIDAPIWMTGEPNNYRNDENCLALRKINGQLQLNDVDCTEQYDFICEDPRP